MSLRLEIPVFRVGFAILPFAVLLAAACGGSDVADDPDAQAGDAGDSGVRDGSIADHQVADQGVADQGAADQHASDGATADASDSTVPPVDASDAGHDAGDGATVDASDAAHLDASDASDASDANDASDASDASDANDAGDANDASDASDASDATSDSGTLALMPSLGTASTYAVLSAATVTNSDVGGLTTVLLGDVGTTGPSITGLTGHPFEPSGNTVIGLAATQPVLDTGTALVFLNGQACGTALTGQDLGGLTLTPGVYCFTSSALQSANTVLTFDAKNDPNAVFIVQIGTALTVLDGASVNLINGASGCRIWFALGTSATLNGGVLYAGNMVAGAGVSLLKAASLKPGRALATTQGVTLLSNTIEAVPACQ